jgi:hypothetical protein
MARLVPIAICTVMLGQGCTVIASSDQSVMQPRSEPPSKGVNCLALDSVTIKVIPENGKHFALVGPFIPIMPIWHSAASNRFWFQISLSPNNGEITFDPSLVTLETEAGDTFFAAGFNGPLRLSDVIQNQTDTREKLLDAKSLNVSVSSFRIAVEVLVGLMFETKTINPDQHFRLVLRGLERGGDPIQVPPLEFNKERRRYFYFSLIRPLSIHSEWVVQ